MKYMNNHYGYKRIFRHCHCNVPPEGGPGDDPDAGGDGSGGGSGKPPEDPAKPPAEPETPSFDDLMKDKAYQAEFDRRVQKAVTTALSKAKDKWEAMANDKLSEAEKLAKMTKEEKTQYLIEKREKELADKEATITRRELMAEAKNTLAEKKLPLELVDILNYADADACNASITAVEKAFQSALEAAVEQRLKGGKPPKSAPEGGTFTREQVAGMSPEEINKNWDGISKSMAAWK